MQPTSPTCLCEKNISLINWKRILGNHGKCVSGTVYCVFGHDWLFFDGFLHTVSDILVILQPLWSYLNFFSTFFRIENSDRSMGREKHKIIILKGLAGLVLIKICTIFFTVTLCTVMDKKWKLCILSWSQALEHQLLLS